MTLGLEVIRCVTCHTSTGGVVQAMERSVGRRRGGVRSRPRAVAVANPLSATSATVQPAHRPGRRRNPILAPNGHRARPVSSHLCPPLSTSVVLTTDSSPVSIQSQSLALRALREIFTQQTQAPANRNAWSKQWQP